MATGAEEPKQTSLPACFVIMPITDPEDYEPGHFRKVYEDLFTPACAMAGFSAIRADDVKDTSLIHLDILEKLIDSPMAICDLSSRNPNVLFELGLRQAFDKPTVLVQETDTPRIFDIAPLRSMEYRRALRYRDVLEDQKRIAEAIDATRTASAKGNNINSIVRILSISKPAELPTSRDNDPTAVLQLIRAEMSDMRSEFQKAVRSLNARSDVDTGDDFTTRHGISPKVLHVVADKRYRRALDFMATGDNDLAIRELKEAISRLAELREHPNASAGLRKGAGIFQQKCERVKSDLLRSLNPDVANSTAPDGDHADRSPQ